MTAIEHVAPAAPSLDDLAQTINREHTLVCQSAVAAVEHAIAAGDALLAAKAALPWGEWEGWLAANLPGKHAKTWRAYMRIAKHQDRIRREQPHGVKAALTMLQGESFRVAEDSLRESARAMAKAGQPYGLIAKELDVSEYFVTKWVNPNHVKRLRARRKSQSREERMAFLRQEREKLARRTSKAYASAYTHLQFLRQELQRALDQEGDAEAKQALSKALHAAYAVEDHVGAAVRLHEEKVTA